MKNVLILKPVSMLSTLEIILNPRRALPLILVALVAACGGDGPTQKDINKAFSEAQENAVKALEEFMGTDAGEMARERMKENPTELRLLGCAAAENASGHRCDVELIEGDSKIAIPIRIIKDDGEWVIVEGLN
jgi:hypothetical protein